MAPLLTKAAFATAGAGHGGEKPPIVPLPERPL